jgi:3'(2'), 5'-bisphosphate nucleotidase
VVWDSVSSESTKVGAEIEGRFRYAAFTPIPDAPADLTTEADLAAQERILEHLRRDFPGDGICAEESSPGARAAPAPAASRRFWVIDPLDGTRGFARHAGEFAVHVALVEGVRPVLGVVVEPLAERVTWAIEGGGCWSAEGGATPSRCAVSAVAGTPEVLALSRSRDEESRRALLAAFGARRALATWSAGRKLALVARGVADLYVGDYLTLHDWDVCAGHLLVEEAGGRVTDVRGEPIVYDGSGASLRGRGLLASNGRVHAAALRALAAGAVSWR